MLELLKYLRANQFKTFIVTGGGQDFVRVFADQVYGVPPEQVVGSAGKTKYEYGKNGQPMLMKLPEVLLIDDNVGKPEGINLFIGRRPVAAFGNSTGDQQMLEWTQASDIRKSAKARAHDAGASRRCPARIRIRARIESRNVFRRLDERSEKSQLDRRQYEK